MNTKLQRVLVIDDDAVVSGSFDRVLSDKGYQVTTALSGEEGLASMNENDFDVVFTDIKMPGMDGLEVTERIKERCPWTPVVVITGYGTEENESRASVLGANGFVQKPLTPQMIEDITLKAVSESARPTEVTATAGAVIEAKTVIAEKVVLRQGPWGLAKFVGMLMAAPFIALAYIIALPFIGFYQFAKLAGKAYKKNHPSTLAFIKNVALFFAAPFIALAYIIALPFVGFFMFTKLALEASK